MKEQLEIKQPNKAKTPLVRLFVPIIPFDSYNSQYI